MTIEFGKNAQNSFNFVDVFQNRQQLIFSVPVADRLLDGGGGKSYLIQALLVRFMQTRYLRGVEMHQQQSEIHFYKVGAPTPTISCKSPHNSQDVSHICKTGYWTINCTE